MNFIDRDYKDCNKKISHQTKNYQRELQCYNTWYKQCMIFVRDYDSCQIYRNSWAEYLYYLWLKNEAPPVPGERAQGYHHFSHGIV
jgi:hypothetical protein